VNWLENQDYLEEDSKSRQPKLSSGSKVAKDLIEVLQNRHLSFDMLILPLDVSRRKTVDQLLLLCYKLTLPQAREEE
jgi:hypothetical protein